MSTEVYDRQNAELCQCGHPRRDHSGRDHADRCETCAAAKKGKKAVNCEHFTRPVPSKNE